MVNYIKYYILFKKYINIKTILLQGDKILKNLNPIICNNCKTNYYI